MKKYLSAENTRWRDKGERKVRNRKKTKVRGKGGAPSQSSYVKSSEEDGSRLLSVTPSDRVSGNVYKQNYGKFHLNIRRHFPTVSEAKHLRKRLPSKSAESPSLEIVHRLGQPAAFDPALRRRWT